MKNRKLIKNVSLPVFSGILGVLAFPPFELSFLGWFCLVPLLIVVKEETPKRSFCYGCISGMVFFIGLIYWLVNVTYPGTFFLIIVLSVFYGIFGLIANLVMRNSIDLMILPFVWVVLEYIRSHLFGGFPWGLLGYSQYQNLLLIQISDFTGPYGVSFLLAVISIGIFSFLKRIRKFKTHMVVAFMFLFLFTSYGVYKLKNNSMWSSLRISVVQGNIEQQLKWDDAFAEDIVNKYEKLTVKAAKMHPDLIVWPETSYPYLVQNLSSDVKAIKDLSRENKISILSGFVSERDNVFYNSALLFDEKGESDKIYNKIHLVPFGEYIPFESFLSFLREFIDKPIGKFVKGTDYTLFQINSVKLLDLSGGARSRKTSFHKFGVLICFEDIFPYISRRFVKNGADFLVNITNDAWFGRTPGARQHLQSSVFRAVENRVPLIRAANTGISCFIDSRGKILSVVSEDNEEIFISGISTVDVNFGRRGSFYTFYGDVFIYLSIFIIGLFVALEKVYIKKRKNQAKKG